MAFIDVRLTRAELREVSVPLRVPFAISGGVMTHRRSLIVVLESEEGMRGFGEAAPFERPFYSGETIASATSCLRDELIPRMIGTQPGHSAEVWELLGDNVRGNRMARAAVETAWWDLQSRLQGCALRQLIDDRLVELRCANIVRDAAGLTAGAALGIPRDHTVGSLLAQVEDAVALGFRRIKIKVMPGWSVKPLMAVRDKLRRMGLTMGVSVDANAAFHIGRDEAELRELDGAGAMFLEQPFAEEDLWDCTAWNRDAITPVCLDETLVSDDVARQVLEMQGPTIWNLKVQRLGGIEETCRVYARGAAAGVRMWMGTMPETGLGAQAALAFGGLSALAFPSDVGPSRWWFAPGSDLVEVTMDGSGCLDMPAKPGNLPKAGDFSLVARWD